MYSMEVGAWLYVPAKADSALAIASVSLRVGVESAKDAVKELFSFTCI